MRELFIYYRIHASNAACALDAAQAMQQGLCTRYPKLAARLLRRPDEPGEKPNTQQTWMEIYSFAAPGGVPPELQTEIEARAAAVLQAFIAGSRHTEVFVPCAS